MSYKEEQRQEEFLKAQSDLNCLLECIERNPLVFKIDYNIDDTIVIHTVKSLKRYEENLIQKIKSTTEALERLLA